MWILKDERYGKKQTKQNKTWTSTLPIKKKQQHERLLTSVCVREQTLCAPRSPTEQSPH